MTENTPERLFGELVLAQALVHICFICQEGDRSVKKVELATVLKPQR